MNDAERLLRGRHIVDLAGDFEKIDYAIERIHDLLKGSYYELRTLAEHGRDEDRLQALRKAFDRNYLALRDVVSGYLRLEGAHDRLYELMGDDKVRAAEARRAAYRVQDEREQAAEAEEERRRRQGFRATQNTAQPPPAAPVDVDATVLSGVSAADVAAAIASARASSTADSVPPSEAPTRETSRAALDHVVAETTAQVRRAHAASTAAASPAVVDWDMPTVQVSAQALAAALKGADK